jgi:hypothetical protein
VKRDGAEALSVIGVHDPESGLTKTHRLIETSRRKRGRGHQAASQRNQSAAFDGLNALSSAASAPALIEIPRTLVTVFHVTSIAGVFGTQDLKTWLDGKVPIVSFSRDEFKGESLLN